MTFEVCRDILYMFEKRARVVTIFELKNVIHRLTSITAMRYQVYLVRPQAKLLQKLKNRGVRVIVNIRIQRDHYCELQAWGFIHSIIYAHAKVR